MEGSPILGNLMVVKSMKNEQTKSNLHFSVTKERSKISISAKQKYNSHWLSAKSDTLMNFCTKPFSAICRSFSIRPKT
jgi:hypothetical protein